MDYRKWWIFMERHRFAKWQLLSFPFISAKCSLAPAPFVHIPCATPWSSVAPDGFGAAAVRSPPSHGWQPTFCQESTLCKSWSFVPFPANPKTVDLWKYNNYLGVAFPKKKPLLCLYLHEFANHIFFWLTFPTSKFCCHLKNKHQKQRQNNNQNSIHPPTPYLHVSLPYPREDRPTNQPWHFCFSASQRCRSNSLNWPSTLSSLGQKRSFVADEFGLFLLKAKYLGKKRFRNGYSISSKKGVISLKYSVIATWKKHTRT